MKSLNLFTRAFTIIVVLTLGSLALAGYSAKQAYDSDPELLAKIQKQFGIHINTNNNNFYISGYGNGDPTQDEWKMPLAENKISIETRSGNISIKTTSANEISIFASGKLDKSRAPRLLDIDTANGELVINEPNNGVDELEMRIEVPSSFRSEIDVLSISGDISIENLSANNLVAKTTSGETVISAAKVDSVTLVTVSGDMRVYDSAISSLNSKSVSGEIDIDSRGTSDVKLKSVSGNIKLKLPMTDSFRFNLKSVSGDIKTVHTDKKDSAATVDINTVSGDIDVN